MIRLLIFIAVFFMLFACAPENGAHKPIAESGPLGEFSTGGYEEVKPIFAKYCAACHPSRSGPNWLDFSQASVYAKNGKLLRRAGIERSMPPPGSAQAAQLSESERLVIINWAKAGGPQNSMTSQGSPQEQGQAQGQELSARERMIQNCLHCHGAHGPDPSAEPRIPVLAGQNRDYLVAQLSRFKSGERIDPTQTMNGIAIDLSDEQIAAAAKYFAAQDARLGIGEKDVPPEKRDSYRRGEVLAKRACNSCHRNPENGFRPTSSRLPALAGQSRVYLLNQLHRFKNDERSNPVMRQFARELSELDIEALATYFSYVR